MKGDRLNISRPVRRWAAAAAVLFALTLAPRAFAQVASLFYAEEKKENRIFVFNVKVNWERFVAAGETGTGLTRIGVGPAGETVFADNETALELFFFKYGIKEEVVRPKAPTNRVSWANGRTTFDWDTGQLNFSNRLQLRFTQEMPDSKVRLAGTDAAGDQKGSFRIRRYEPQFTGWFYKPYITAQLEFAFQDLNAAGPGSAGLNDMWINYDFSKGPRKFRIQMGQFKVPFGRQELSSSHSQQFVDRSIVAGEYERGRDLGAQIDGYLFNNKIEWRTGLFNGNGRSNNTNDNAKYQYDARVMYQLGGRTVPYSESDFESTDKPLLGIAMQFEANDFANTVTTTPLPVVVACPCVNGGALKRTAFGPDVSFKFKRFFLMAAYYDRQVTPASPVGSTFKSNGYHMQASYLFDKGRHFEVGGRWASWDPTDKIANNDRTEIGGVFNYFYNRHPLKVQLDFRQLEDKLAKTKNKEFRIGTQFFF